MSASVSPSAGVVAEVAQAVDHLLGRPAADAQLEPAAGDEVGRAGVLGHVQRVLVAHVDDGGADLDPAGARADRGQQRERRARAGGRSGGRGSTRRRPRAPRRRRPARWTGAARPTPLRTCEYGASDQCPNDRNPIFFTDPMLSPDRDPAGRPIEDAAPGRARRSPTHGGARPRSIRREARDGIGRPGRIGRGQGPGGRSDRLAHGGRIAHDEQAADVGRRPARAVAARASAFCTDHRICCSTRRSSLCSSVGTATCADASASTRSMTPRTGR